MTTQPIQEGISCSSTATFTSIKITCTNRNSLISGIQFIAQSSDLKEREKLYVSERFSFDSMVEITLPIKVDPMGGMYQVTGFGIIGEMINSVVYTNRVQVNRVTISSTIRMCAYIYVLP